MDIKQSPVTSRPPLLFLVLTVWMFGYFLFCVEADVVFILHHQRRIDELHENSAQVVGVDDLEGREVANAEIHHHKRQSPRNRTVAPASQVTLPP
ncbi:hypothetical protein B0T22DRAFT_300077 [Podospora appendiculata]|uniref:Uncharacterized protein n=1 Tax=Podospora appendiculata TaxID=314037 RepID=A0AAE0WZY1_9PEZI|nr:hypothetical protein B0T22DRAFT_300077 [Podospora appendiculata]